MKLWICCTQSILNSDLANLAFATLSLTFRGHEAGLFHVVISFPVVWSAMSYSSSIGNDFCSTVILYATALVVHFLFQVAKVRLQF